MDNPVTKDELFVLADFYEERGSWKADRIRRSFSHGRVTDMRLFAFLFDKEERFDVAVALCEWMLEQINEGPLVTADLVTLWKAAISHGVNRPDMDTDARWTWMDKSRAIEDDMYKLRNYAEWEDVFYHQLLAQDMASIAVTELLFTKPGALRVLDRVKKAVAWTRVPPVVEDDDPREDPDKARVTEEIKHLLVKRLWTQPL